MTKKKKELATFDIETDPFLHNRVPKPFCCGFKIESYYKEWWGSNCLMDFYRWVKLEDKPYLIYAHNGGKFDFMYLFWLGLIDKIKLINGRIVKANMGIHELRDSYAIIPVPLAAYEKDTINYEWFEEDVREFHRADILYYLRKDCDYLYELVFKFRERFGDNLTIGGTAIKELRSRHPFENRNKNHDTAFRPYYFGGRVQFFQSGIISDKYKVFDVNSMYPCVMANERHPTGKQYVSTTDLDYALNNSEMFFIRFRGKSRGAFPIRTKNGLDFPGSQSALFTDTYEFHTTSHELKVAMEHNLVEIESIIEILIPTKTINFRMYVNHYMEDKIKAKESGNKADELFAKLLLNSAYGKFGQNPDNFYDYILRYPDEELPDLDEWELYVDNGYLEIWRSPAPRPTYYDVATAASITSAARAVLLDAICRADTPIYCDTDSIICKELSGVDLHDSRLGAWALEATCDKIAIAGKKLYAVWYKGELLKKANKGVKLTGDEIELIALGIKIEWKNPAPSFSVNSPPPAFNGKDEIKFITRTVANKI